MGSDSEPIKYSRRDLLKMGTVGLGALLLNSQRVIAQRPGEERFVETQSKKTPLADEKPQPEISVKVSPEIVSRTTSQKIELEGLNSEEKNKENDPVIALNRIKLPNERLISNWGRWENLGPKPDLSGDQWKGDGGRSNLVFDQGRQAFYSTWEHGNYYFDGKKWFPIPIDDRNGIVRQIVQPMTSENLDLQNWTVMIADTGISVLKKESKGFNVRNHDFSVPGEFFQTGCLYDNHKGDMEMIIGGHGALYRVEKWDRFDNNIKITGLPIPFFDEQPMLIRSVVVDSHDPQKIYIGGWVDYSGWEWEDNPDKTIKPGAGVWFSKDGGITWKQILSDINVNSILQIDENRLVVGTEGSGEWHRRVADPRFPSLFTTFDGGMSWQVLDLKLPWDLVTPQCGLKMVGNRLIVSGWGGPITVTNDEFPTSVSSKVFTLPRVILGNDRLDWQAGHLNVWEDNKGKIHIATGGKNYYDREEKFTQLREIVEVNRKGYLFEAN